MNLITDDWRLKLLAVGLAVLMLGAVAFSQNPQTTKTFQVPLNYAVSKDLVLINPPSQASVTVSGPADAIGPLTVKQLVAGVDATRATPGPAVRLNVVAHALVGNVIVQNPPPFAASIDRFSADKLTVETVYRPAAGWQVTKPPQAQCPQSPCVVTFTGPASWEVNLKAVATFPSPIDGTTVDWPTVPIVLKQGNVTLDESTRAQTVPASFLDIANVNLHAEAQTGTASRSVALVDSNPSHGPATGYHVTGVTINPITVVLTGPEVELAQIQSITLPAIDLSGQTSTYTAKVTIPIPKPTDITSNVATASITYQIQPNPAVSPSPTPT
jgi:YbbR-like protein